MMSTRKERNDKTANITPEANLIRYRWKKNWVRPYESIYSIMRNFCKVNVFQGSYAMKILEVTGSGFRLPVTKIMMYSNAKQDARNYDKLFEALLPEWYIQQIMPMTTLNTSVFTELVDPQIKYCPECAKENYHSFLFQFRHVKECPFHHVSLIKTSWDYTVQGNIVYKDGTEYINVRNDILPCERQCRKESYQMGFTSSLRYFFPVSSISSDKYPKFLHVDDIFFQKNHATYTLKIKKSKLSLTELKQLFIQWFDNQKVPINLINPKVIMQLDKELTYLCKEIYASDYLTFLLYYLFFDLMKDYDLSTEAASNIILNLHDEPERVLYPHEEIELRISYLWSIISCDNPFSCLSYKKIFSPYSAELRNTRDIYNGVHIEDIYKYNMQFVSKISQVDEIIILMKILYDLFYCIWKQLQEIVEIEGQISVRNGWKLISVPEYYVCINEGDDFYNILRYDNQ